MLLGASRLRDESTASVVVFVKIAVTHSSQVRSRCEGQSPRSWLSALGPTPMLLDWP